MSNQRAINMLERELRRLSLRVAEVQQMLARLRAQQVEREHAEEVAHAD